MTISFTLKIISMLLILTMMIMVASSTLMNFIHPLMLILTLVIYTTMNLFLMYINTSLSMYMYMIFISIIGGMMIMFLYFTSMINNYPSKIKLNESLMIIYMITTMALFTLYTLWLPSTHSMFFFNNSHNLNSMIFIYKIYLHPLSLMTMITILNLLYCLILTIKMSSSKYSPLRKINYEKI